MVKSSCWPPRRNTSCWARIRWAKTAAARPPSPAAGLYLRTYTASDLDRRKKVAGDRFASTGLFPGCHSRLLSAKLLFHATGAWEFWIDVGGTFTDCFAPPPDGALRRHKLLSSGVTKGGVAPARAGRAIVDRSAPSRPADFWTGYAFRLLDAAGAVIAESRVTAFDRRRRRPRLAPPLSVDSRRRVRPTSWMAAKRRRSSRFAICLACRATPRFRT